MILIINGNGALLCNDSCWRAFAMFGSVKGCAKQYKSLSHAQNRARHVGGVVVKVPDGMSVEAGGTVIESVPCADKPGYVNYKHHKLIEFKVTA
jgi:hypothetical protein